MGEAGRRCRNHGLRSHRRGMRRPSPRTRRRRSSGTPGWPTVPAGPQPPTAPATLGAAAAAGTAAGAAIGGIRRQRGDRCRRGAMEDPAGHGGAGGGGAGGTMLAHGLGDRSPPHLSVNTSGGAGGMGIPSSPGVPPTPTDRRTGPLPLQQQHHRLHRRVDRHGPAGELDQVSSSPARSSPARPRSPRSRGSSAGPTVTASSIRRPRSRPSRRGRRARSPP